MTLKKKFFRSINFHLLFWDEGAVLATIQLASRPPRRRALVSMYYRGTLATRLVRFIALVRWVH